MPAELTRAFVLRADPYRESSFLLHLLSREHGVLRGIAKGVRRAKSTAPFVERGMLIETIVYLREHRDLHTCGSVQVIEYYPDIRRDIVSSALRDAALELLARAVKQVEPHPELFDLVSVYVTDLSRRGALPRVLWGLYRDIAAALGFAMNLRTCVACGTDLSGAGGTLLSPRGGLACRRCRPVASPVFDMPDAVTRLLRGEDIDQPGSMPAAEIRRITRLLAGYCALHCDISPEFKSLDFLDEVWSGGR